MRGVIRLYYKGEYVGRGIVCSHVCNLPPLVLSLSIPLLWCMISFMYSLSAPWSRAYSQYWVNVYYAVTDLEYQCTQAQGLSLSVYDSKKRIQNNKKVLSLRFNKQSRSLDAIIRDQDFF